MSEALFPVREEPAVFQDDPSGYIKTGHKFIIREDTNEILSCMTDEYKLVTNQEVYDASQDALQKAGAVEREVKVLNDGKRTMWRYVIPNVKVKVAKDDYVNPEIMIKNSYDGSWEIGIIAGAYRLVCSNGMVIGVILSKKTNRHSIYNPRIAELPALIEETIQNTSEVFKSDFALMLETKVRQSHVQELIKMIPTNVMEGFIQYLCTHKPDTYWDLFNAATWVNTHHMNRDFMSTHKFESQIFPTVRGWANQVASA